ncbi:stage II sporulation protein M [Priestia sp. SB1]|uniref:stage II sporulation protein M n=1 Tax=Priestia sp. SB1 TaxID=3132359 RepID=UPI00317945BB
MDYLTQFFSKEHLSNVGKTLWKWWVASFAIIVVAYLITYLVDPDVKKTMNGIRNALSGTGGKESYWEGTFTIFKNNWGVCLQVLILSFIPIPFLYTYSLILTNALIGVVVYLSQKAGLGLIHTILAGLLPHAVLEISTFILAIYYGRKINKIIIGKITNKLRSKNKDVPQLWKQVKETLIIFVCVITPAIFLAAFIEGYLSRFLLNY